MTTVSNHRKSSSTPCTNLMQRNESSFLTSSIHKQKSYNTIEVISTTSSGRHYRQRTHSADNDSLLPPPSDFSDVPTNHDIQRQEEKNFGNISLILLTICLSIGACLHGLDISIVYTIMTKIGSEFQNADHSVWTHSSYTLGVLITMPTAGGLSNALGRKPVLIALNVLFMVGSIGCAYAQTFNQVIVSRVIAGLGGGGIVLLGNVILQDVVPHDRLGTYLPFVTTSSTVCFAFGGFVGGFLTDHFGWRACFKINILPVLFTLYVYTFHLKNYPIASPNPLSSSPPSTLSLLSQQENKTNEKLKLKEKLCTVDFGGITLLSIANVCLTCTILLAGEGSYPLDSPLILMAFTSVPLAYALFFLHQMHWASNPLIPRKMLSDRHFTVTCICGFLSGACESAACATIPQFLMGVLHFNISDSGIWLMLEAMAVPVGCFVASRYMQHTGRFSRFLFIVTGTYVISQTILNRWVVDTVSVIIGTFGVILEGFSFGAITITILLIVNSTLPNELAAAAMSIFLLSRNIGFLSGAASSSAIIQYNLKLLLPTRIEGPDAEKLIKFIVSSIRKVYLLPPEIQEIVADVLRIALQRATYFIIAASILMFLLSTRYKNISFVKKEQDNCANDNDDSIPPQ